MITVYKKLKAKKEDESGVLIIEAAIIFPIMFFLLFFILYIGNFYYEMAQIDDAVMRAAIKGAQNIADPQHDMMQKYNVFPTKINDVQPYRYLFGEVTTNGSVNKIEKNVTEELREEIEGNCISLFKNMKPVITTSDGKISEFHNYFIYSTFQVHVDYDVKIPIRFIWEKNFTVFHMSSNAEVSVNDTPEFIRDVDMVVDYVSETKAGKTIKKIFSKINNFIGKFSNTPGT